MSCLSWNIEGLTLDKCSSEDFISVTLKYDIVCLSETWTNSNSFIDKNGYCNPINSFRRYRHRLAKRASGGVIICIKNVIRKGVILVCKDVDYLVWLELDKYFFSY